DGGKQGAERLPEAIELSESVEGRSVAPARHHGLRPDCQRRAAGDGVRTSRGLSEGRGANGFRWYRLLRHDRLLQGSDGRDATGSGDGNAHGSAIARAWGGGADYAGWTVVLHPDGPTVWEIYRGDADVAEISGSTSGAGKSVHLPAVRRDGVDTAVIDGSEDGASVGGGGAGEGIPGCDRY